MRREIGAATISVVWIGLTSSFLAYAGDITRGANLAHRGNAIGAPACSGCHGDKGQGQSGAGIPRLAGLNATYLDNQLAAFGNGARDNAIMTPIVKTLDPAARADLAAFYAGLPTPAVAEASASRDLAAGETLAFRGAWGANVPPCASCHGGRGLGVGGAFPALAGQSATYIANQLRAWKSGNRHDDPLGLMKSVAGHLDDAQIAAVAAYYASLPAAPPKHPAKT